ncbi:hypothetical protein THII_1049 [Thioploca ingrica]|uniref:Gingipain domain-containing protein n=1 Tax=Thioploca ingrica TaxID=40754 RepID=A0A090BUM1_9GAMM|nr:hypothetical protein THII_1049 [Thioploca ingrica]
MNHRIFPIFIFSVIVSLTPTVKANSAIQLLSSHESELVLQLILPDFSLQTQVESGCQQIDIANWATTSTPGYPEIPMVGTLIQIPNTGEISAHILAAEYETISATELCPTPTPLVSTRGEVTYSLTKNKIAYQSNHFWPTTELEIGTRQVLRGVPVSRISIFPFQWNPVTQELRYLKKLSLQVQFEAVLSPVDKRTRERNQSVADSYAALLQNVLINYQPPALSSSKRGSRSQAETTPVAETETQPTQRLIKADNTLRIEITQDGIYRLSYEQLAEVGLPVQFINPTRLQLFHQDQEIAIQVNSQQPDQFEPGDYIEFYGQGVSNNIFTDTNVYWLSWQSRIPGKRVVPLDSHLTPESENNLINTFYNHLHLEEDKQSWLGTPGAPEQDYWFWQRLNASETGSFTFELTSVSPTPTEATIRVGFRGRSTATPHPDHHTLIKLNDTLIGDEHWDGDVEFIQPMSFSSELLKIGQNQLNIEMPGDTGAIVDVVYPNWIEINSWQNLEVKEDKLTFTIPGAASSRQIMIDKLTQPELVIYDITNPNEVVELTDFSVTESESTYQVRFTTSATADKTYFISTLSQIQSPNRIIPWQTHQLKNIKNAADYILITTSKFLPAVEPLVQLRRQQGLRVKAVSMEQIYNEFNAGLAEPKAIKQFLTYAYENWRAPAPTEVFLVGDASLNYKKIQGKSANKVSQVPTYLSPSWDGLTPDDSWYVSIDGDDNLPDMFIGRIPGNTPEKVAELINKIVRFEKSNQPSPRKILLATDSEQDFEDSSEELVNHLPVGFSTDKVYLQSYLALTEEGMTKDDKIDRATQDIIASMNQGIMISSYIGHGVVNQWSGSKGLFKPEDLQQVTNEEQLFFAFMLTCINGYFVGDKYALAEEFVLAKGGAIGSFAPSNLSYLWEDAILAQEAFSILFEQGVKRLGALTTQAKIAAYGKGTSADVIKTFTLFGDPAVSLKDWQ